MRRDRAAWGVRVRRLRGGRGAHRAVRPGACRFVPPGSPSPSRPGRAPRRRRAPPTIRTRAVSRVRERSRPPGGRSGPSGAAPHRELASASGAARRMRCAADRGRCRPAAGHQRAARARIGPPPPVAGSIALSAPRRRRGLRRTGRGSCPESAPQGSGPDERTRGRERSQVVAGWRAPAHETAFAADEPLIVRERGTGCALVEGGERLWWGNSLTGDSARQGGAVRAGDVEGARYPDPGRSFHTASATRSSSSGASFASALSSRASVAGVWTTTGPLP